MAYPATVDADGVSVFVNVKQYPYGATGNGTSDDTVAIKAAIAACVAAGGGTVFFPAGTYLVSSSLAISSNVNLLGAGRFATVLKKSANCDLIDASGTATGVANHCRYTSIRNMLLHGNNLTGKLLRAYYADNLRCDSVYFANNLDMGVESAEFWDSYFVDCSFEFCGDAAGTVPEVYLKNAAATVGNFGYSTDNTNMIWMINCRFESFIGGALWIDSLNGNTNNPNGIYLVNCKMETNTVHGNYLRIAATVIDFHANNLYIFGGAFAGGYSTPVGAVQMFGAVDQTIDNIFASASAAVFSSIIEYWPGGNPNRIQNIANTGTAPTVALINFTGGSTTTLYLGDISVWPGTTAFSGTPPNIINGKNIVHTPTFATPYTPDVLNKGNVVIMASVTGALTINAPATQWSGATLQFILTSNATGLFALTWNAVFKTAGVPLPAAMPGPNATIALSFVSDGTSWWYTNNLAPVQSATAVATTSSSTIATGGLDTSRVSPAGAVTSVILASGTYAGQKVWVVNEAIAANSVTFAASGTSHVAAGTGVVLAGLASRQFVWDSSTSLWY